MGYQPPLLPKHFQMLHEKIGSFKMLILKAVLFIQILSILSNFISRWFFNSKGFIKALDVGKHGLRDCIVSLKRC